MLLKNKIITEKEYNSCFKTKFYLIYNKKEERFEKIIFYEVSKIMEQLDFKLFKEYKIEELEKFINKNDLYKELNFIKEHLNKKYFITFHRFFVSNHFFISRIYLKKYAENGNYIFLEGKSNPINHVYEHKILYNLLLLNNFNMLIKYDLASKSLEYDSKKLFNFLNFSEKKKSIQEEFLNKLLKLVDNLNLKNVFLIDNLNEVRNILEIENDPEYFYKNKIELNIGNNFVVPLNVFIFKGIENEKEKYFIILTLINKYNINFLLEIFDIIKNNKNINEIFKLFQNKKKKINLASNIIISNYLIKENKKISENFNLLDKIKVGGEKEIFIYIKKTLKFDDFIKKILFNILDIKLNNIFNEVKKTNYLNLLKEILNNSNDWILITDENRNIIFANKIFEEISGYTLKEVLGKNPNILKSKYTNKETYKEMYEALDKNGYYEGLFINKSKKGNLFYLYNKIIKKNIMGNIYYISISKNISLDKETGKIKEDEIDKLTQLYNRNKFKKIILNRINDNLNKVNYILLLDIANFRTLNLIKGIDFGDKVLKKLAQELVELFGYINVFKDINDRFIITIDEVTLKQYNNTENNLLRIFDIISEELYQKLNYKIYFNISYMDYDNIKNINNVNEILEKLELTLEYLKENITSISNNMLKYSKKYEEDKIFQARKLIEFGLNNNKFFYHYQPIVDLNQNIVGIETLLRLEKDGKIYYPGDFIEYAEKSGEIVKIDAQLVNKLISDIFLLKNKDIFVSFNITSKTLSDNEIFENIIDKIKQVPNKVIFEIIERNLLIEEYINKLKKHNIPISLDDFGTGYSSLFYLSKLKIDKLKIDRFFINKILEDEKVYIIIKNIINICKSLQIDVVAEGIETKKQFETLKKLGCNYFQGFYFYKPMPIERILELISK